MQTHASGPVGVTTQSGDVHCGSFLFKFFCGEICSYSACPLFHPNSMVESDIRSRKKVNRWMFVEQADETQSIQSFGLQTELVILSWIASMALDSLKRAEGQRSFL